MSFFEGNGARMYYELLGRPPGEAPAIIFAHGAGGNHLSWWSQIPYFRSEFTCVVFDHRGFGQSHATDGRGGAAFAGDLLALIEHLGIETASLVAQSMGGWTCLRFALDHPGRITRLVLGDTFAGIAAPGIERVWKAAGELISALPAGVHPAAGTRMFGEQPELHFLYTEIAAMSPPYTPPELIRMIADAGTVSIDELARWQTPTLFVIGDEDIVFPPPYLEAAAACVPGARTVRIERAGHSVYFERADAYNDVVGAFLRGVSNAS